MGMQEILVIFSGWPRGSSSSWNWIPADWRKYGSGWVQKRAALEWFVLPIE